MIDRFNNIFDRINDLPPLPRILIYSVVGLLVLALIWSTLFPSAAVRPSPPHHAATDHTTTVSIIQNPASISPLLFGTNLGLLSNHDQVLTSASTQKLLAQIHTQVIRMPIRTNISEATDVQAARLIKNLNAVPVIDLQGSMDASVLADDSRVIKDMNKIFGTNVVYYEYGNEEDLFDVSVQDYTASWNAVIPKLKKLAPHGQFVGPVTYHYDQAYLTTFLKTAQPRPDEVSWHEYTCVASDDDAACLAHINNWSTHVSNARAAMTTTVGKPLPIMISEWNYAANATSTSNTTASGSNSKNATFLSAWTKKALQTLAANHVFAAMQYFATSSTPLVDSHDKLTPEGKTFQDQYNSMIGSQQHPSAPLPDPSPSPSPSPDPEPSPSPMPSPSPSGFTQVPPQPSPDPEPRHHPMPSPSPDPVASPMPSPSPDPMPSPDPVASPAPIPSPSPMPSPSPEPVASPMPSPDPVASPEPVPSPDPVASPMPSPSPSPMPSPSPEPVASPMPSPSPDPVASPMPSPSPDPVASPQPMPSPSPDPVASPQPVASPSPDPVASPMPSPDPVASPKPVPSPDPVAKPPVPKPLPVCPPTVEFGSTGSVVRMLQGDLVTQYNNHSFSNTPNNFSPPLQVDGTFGPLTRAAVEDYQRAKGLAVDGIVGPKTWGSLLGGCR